MSFIKRVFFSKSILVFLVILIFTIKHEVFAQYNCSWAKNPPKIDGYFDWQNNNSIQFAEGYLLVQNDKTFLYLLLDLTMDTYIDQPLNKYPWGDFFSISFDINNDKKITPNKDLSYGFYPGTYQLGYSYYLRPSTWTGLHKSRAKLGTVYSVSPNSNNQHRIWEIAIPLSEINKKVGQKIRIGIETNSQNPPFRYDHPSNFSNDFSNLLEINLSSGLYPIVIPPNNKSNENGIKGPVQRKILKDGKVELRYPDGTIKRLYEGGYQIVRPDGSAQNYSFLTVQKDYPPELPGNPLITDWLNWFSEMLMYDIKSLVKNDANSINYYVQKENEKARTVYERMYLRLRCIQRLTSE